MQATTCTSCGAPQFAARQKPPQIRAPFRWALYVMAGLFVIGIHAVINEKPSPNSGTAQRNSLDVDPSSFDAREVGTPIAVGASITKDGNFTNSKLAAMVAIVKMAGYRCDEITGAGLKGVLTVDFRLECNGQYFYTLHDKGGQWVVSVE